MGMAVVHITDKEVAMSTEKEKLKKKWLISNNFHFSRSPGCWNGVEEHAGHISMSGSHLTEFDTHKIV